MSDDPIRSALRKAVDVSFSHDGCGVSPPLHVRRVREWRVAHEVAAFLRALPEGTAYTMVPLPLELAAAVERAAGGGDE